MKQLKVRFRVKKKLLFYPVCIFCYFFKLKPPFDWILKLEVVKEEGVFHA